MTYDDFIIELNKAGLTVRRFADLMEMQPNSISNYKKKGEVPDHLAVTLEKLFAFRGYLRPLLRPPQHWCPPASQFLDQRNDARHHS